MHSTPYRDLVIGMAPSLRSVPRCSFRNLFLNLFLSVASFLLIGTPRLLTPLMRGGGDVPKPPPPYLLTIVLPVVFVRNSLRDERSAYSELFPVKRPCCVGPFRFGGLFRPSFPSLQDFFPCPQPGPDREGPSGAGK